MSTQLIEFARVVEEWHGHKVAHLREIQGLMAEGVEVKCGSEKDAPAITLTSREALVFKLGMEACLSDFERLPFTVNKGSDPEEAEDLGGLDGDLKQAR